MSTDKDYKIQMETMMALVKQTSPHTIAANRTQQIMKLVLLTALPGVLAQTLFFGWGTIINILWCSLTAVACEALVLTLRKRSVSFYLNDYSVLVTALLLAVALPSLSPWWLTLIGTAFAVIIGKHLYGGLGQNPFNPAMLGYVLLLISFPQEMTRWPAPMGVTDSIASQPLFDGVTNAFAAISPRSTDSVRM